MWEPDKTRAKCGFRVSRTQRRLLLQDFLYPLFSIIAGTNHTGTATQVPRIYKLGPDNEQ